MDRAAPRRRAGDRTRGKRAAGYTDQVPAYVEPGSGEVAAYDEWDDQGWSEPDPRGGGTGWSEQSWYADPEPPELPQPAPGGGRRIAGCAQEPGTSTPSTYQGKRAARPVEPSGRHETGGYPAYEESYPDASGGWQAGHTGGYDAPVPAPRALSAPPTTPPPSAPPAEPAYPGYEGYQDYPGYEQRADPYASPYTDEFGAVSAQTSGGYDQPEAPYPDAYDPYPDAAQASRTPKKGLAPRAAALLAQPRGATTTALTGLSGGTLALIWAVVLTVGFLLLGVSMLGAGPAVVGGLGATVVGTAYTWALTARIGGRPMVFAALAAVSGLVVLVAGQPWLSTGAAVLVAAVAGVFAVMTTAPARRFTGTVRETLLATAVAVGGSFAALGFEPVLSVERFEYATLAVAIGFAFFAVYRLGAGLHGLGRRGAIVVGIGGLMLALTLLYAEMLRRYGSSGLTDTMDVIQRWCLAKIGGYPRPIEAFIGVPALAWGVHMRTRRRQGWWVCLFGVALTAPVATTLGDPTLGLTEAGLSIVYSLVVGLVLAFAAIRVDLAFSSPSPTGSGRRAVRDDDESAVRPEPGRTRPLL